MRYALYKALCQYWLRKLTPAEQQTLVDAVRRYECFLGMMTTFGTVINHERCVAYYAYTEAKKIYKQRGKEKT